MRGRSIPTLAGRVLGVFAVIAVISSLSIGVRRLLHGPFQYVNDYIALAPDTSLAWALVLALLAAAMSARKRVAWWVTVVFLALFITGNVLNLWLGELTSWELGNTIFGLVLQLVVLAVLIYAYPSFNTRVRAGAGFKALAVLVVGLTVGTFLGWGLVELLPRSVDPTQRFAYALNRVVLLSSVDADLFDGHRSYGIVNLALGFFGAVALILAVIVLFRSQSSSNALTGLDESAIRGLLAEHGQEDSLGYFATRRDKAVIFSVSGDAAIAYRVEAGVCLASGDPIGPREAWSGVIERWIEQCTQFGWTPAAMGASEHGATAFKAAGLQALELGDEAILYTGEFSLSGPDMRGARQAVSRARRAGATVRMRRHRTLTADEMAEVIVRADAWRDTDDERGFSMALGRLGDRLDGDCVLVEAVTGEGTPDERVVAMLSLVPWGTTGVSLDLMRRDRDAPNGVIELMVSEMCVRARELGVTRISLNFAVFRSVFEEGARIGAGPVLRLWRGMLMFLSRWWQLEALYRSNVKYHPSWQARYICFDDARMLARVGMASGIAEGYLMIPSLRRRTGPDPMTVHTGTHPAVPPELVARAGLHSDGSPPNDAGQQDDSELRRPEQVRVRLAKLESLTQAGVDAYPDAQAPSHSVAQSMDVADGMAVHLAGRILRVRDYGAVVFADLRDWTGDVQLIIEPENLTDSMDFASSTDIGDLVDVSGVVGYSRNGTRSVVVQRWRLNAKCLHPLPEKWKGLTDPETRVRMRYVDLAVDASAQQTVRARAEVLTAMRMFLVERGFLEVETPILQRIHGGANATPFRTHINAYGLDLYLRIAPELYLKRLCVGGIEKVFELGRTFRNEGVDFSHNPEFSILEAYQAHSDYMQMLDLTRELIQTAAIAAHGEAVAIRVDGDGNRQRVDISGTWPVVSVYDAISDAVQATVTPESDVEQLRAICDSRGIEYQSDWDAGHVALEMYEHLVEGSTTVPTFYKDFPTSVSPLTKAHPDVPGVAQRWDLVAWGVELGTAYSELTDPVEQRRRLTEQSLLAAGGDPEAMELDEDFLRALEYGMPPTGGLGIGVDRIVMLITGLSIRESLPFPLVKPRDE